jgi:hypothetical protein
MAAVRELWTDARLDDLNVKVGDGFRRMDERFVQVDARFDALYRLLFRCSVGTLGVVIAAAVTLVATGR